MHDQTMSTMLVWLRRWMCDASRWRCGRVWASDWLPPPTSALPHNPSLQLSLKSSPMLLRPPTPQATSPEKPADSKDDSRLRFTQIMNSLKTVYPAETLRDISTSFGFICLLHLANEQGLILESDMDKITSGASTLEEIFVSRDVNAVLEEAHI